MSRFTFLLAAVAVATALMLPAGGMAQTAGQKSAHAAAKASATATAAPSDREITGAKAKGLVWVNTATKVYHKDGQFYGKTKQGKFMTESDAQKAGFHAAKQTTASTKKAAKK